MFELGRVVATPNALALLALREVPPKTLLDRHKAGDWGDLDDHDKEVNATAVKDGGRIISAYRVTPIERVWLITEWDRSATTILLPGEY